MTSTSEATTNGWVEKIAIAIAGLEREEIALLDYIAECVPTPNADQAAHLRDMIDSNMVFVEGHGLVLKQILQRQKNGLLMNIDPVPYRTALRRFKAAIALAAFMCKGQTKIKPTLKWWTGIKGDEWLQWGFIDILRMEKFEYEGKHYYKIRYDGPWDVLLGTGAPDVEIITYEDEDCDIVATDDGNAHDRIQEIVAQAFSELPHEILIKAS
jgi:hypothetical protein